MQFIENLNQHISKGRIESFLADCNMVSECLGLKNEIRQLTFRVSRLKERQNSGAIIYSDEVITENKIAESLIEIMSNIEKEPQLLRQCLSRRLPIEQERILSILELIPSIVESILIENQKILTNLFTEQESVEQVMVKMITLYNNQGNRRNFAEWITTLETLNQNAFSSEIRKEITFLIEKLSGLKTTIYSYDYVELSPKRMIKFKMQVTENLIDDNDIKKFHLTILNKFPPQEIHSIVTNYLNYLRNSLENITSACVKIKNTIIE